MRKLICLILFLFCLSQLSSQNILKGLVLDEETKETLIGANILLIDNGGTATNYDGEFEFNNLTVF